MLQNEMERFPNEGKRKNGHTAFGVKSNFSKNAERP